MEKNNIINIHKDNIHTCTTTSYSVDRKMIIIWFYLQQMEPEHVDAFAARQSTVSKD